MDLARNDQNGPVQVGDISKRQNISVKYIEQLIRHLKKAEYITSVRGPKGGHVLDKKPHEITVGHVIRTFESKNGKNECICNQEKCSMINDCRLRQAWDEAIRIFYETLDDTSIADLHRLCCDESG